MKTIISAMLVIIICTTMVSGCSQEEGRTIHKNESSTNSVDTLKEHTSSMLVSKPTEITFVYAGGDPLVKEMTSSRVQQFNSETEGVTIIEVTSGSGTYLDFVKTQEAVGNFPDMMNSRNTQIWVDSGKLAELPQSVVEMFENPPSLNDQYYVAPVSLYLPSRGIYYNKKIFEELALEEPSTYAEFEAICEAIKIAEIAPLVQGGKDVWHIGFLWSQIWGEKVFSSNPDWIAEKYQGKVSFTDQNVIETIEKYASLYEKGYIEERWFSTSDNQIVSAIMAERAAMFYSGSWMINQVYEVDPDFNLGWFPMPDEAGKINLLYGPDLEGFAFSKEASEDPDKVIAFEAFMKFWFDQERYAEYCQTIVAAPSIEMNPEITYSSDLPQEFNEALDAAEFVDVAWSQKWGESALPGDFRDFAYEAFREKVITGSSAMELGELLDGQWDIEVAKSN